VLILHRVSDKARYWLKIADLNLLHLYLAPPLGVNLSKFCRDLSQQKTRVHGRRCVSYVSPSWYNTGVWFWRYANGQTDRQTDRYTETL